MSVNGHMDRQGAEAKDARSREQYLIKACRALARLVGRLALPAAAEP